MSAINNHKSRMGAMMGAAYHFNALRNRAIALDEVPRIASSSCAVQCREVIRGINDVLTR
jgi:hypothetical protein